MECPAIGAQLLTLTCGFLISYFIHNHRVTTNDFT